MAQKPDAKQAAGKGKKKGKEEVKVLSPEEETKAAMEAGIAQEMYLSRTAYFGQTKLLSDLLADKDQANAAPGEEEPLTGDPPLVLACKNGHAKAAKVLIDAGVSSEARGLGGLTALHYAARNDYMELCEYLIKDAKCAVDIDDDMGSSPLHEACRMGNLRCVVALLDLGANPEKENRQGNTPFLSACAFSRPAIVDLFLRRKANGNKQNRTGNTGLHIAAKQGDLKVVKMLLAGKVNTRATNNDGNFPEDVADKATQEYMRANQIDD